MKIHKILATVLCCVVVFCQPVQAQQKQKSPEDARVARLAGLAKVWGTVKFFHPYLAYRNIDWDKALIETIPKVNAAKTPQEYETAVNQMLAALNDKRTRADVEPEIPDVSETIAPPDAKYVRTVNKVLVIETSLLSMIRNSCVITANHPNKALMRAINLTDPFCIDLFF